jgi:hypothetical protein
MRGPRIVEAIVLGWLFTLLAACAASERDSDSGTRDDERESFALDDEAGSATDAAADHDAAALDAARIADGGQAARHDAARPPLNALPACPGHMHPAPGQACRTLSDCGGGSFACAAGVIFACGVCSTNNMTPCSGDAQCGANFVCEPTRAGSWGFPFAGCINACSAGSCFGGTRCAANGHCEPIPCSDGGACPADRLCDPSRSGADKLGCVPKSCEADGYVCPPKYRCGGAQPDVYGCSPRLCSEDYACPVGSECGGTAPDGHGCSLVSCTEGYECPPNTDCKSGPARDHGCLRRACSADSDCDCGACLGRVCEDQLHVCSWGAP